MVVPFSREWGVTRCSGTIKGLEGEKNPALGRGWGRRRCLGLWVYEVGRAEPAWVLTSKAAFLLGGGSRGGMLGWWASCHLAPCCWLVPLSCSGSAPRALPGVPASSDTHSLGGEGAHQSILCREDEVWKCPKGNCGESETLAISGM